MSKWLASFLAIAVVVPMARVGSAEAADQSVAPRVRAHHVAAPDCGACGCWHPEYVSHPETVYQYPSDPRYTLTSEPYYLPGPVRRYAHNWF
jgi:hypothetical protein